MRTHWPALRRLLALAAVPARCGQAWRALDDVAARLDRPLDVAAAAQGARVEALLGAPPVGDRLLPALARLALAPPLVDSADAAGAGTALATAPSRTAGSDSAAGRLRLQPAAPVDRAAGPLAAGARWPAQGPARMAFGAVALAGREAASAATGLPNTAMPALPARAPLARAERATPDGRSAITKATPAAPATPGAAPLPDALMAGLPRAAPPVAGRRPLPSIDAAAAQAAWQARLQAAAVAPAWHQVLTQPGDASARLGEAAGLAPGPAVAGANPPGAGPAAADTPVDLAQRLARTLDHLAAQPAAREPRAAPGGGARSAVAGPRPPVHNAGAPNTAVRSVRAQPAAALALPRGARLGGFKGLVAQGQALARSAPDASANPAAAPLSAAQAHSPLPDVRPIDPGTLVEQVESALREQAARNGINLGGLEP